MKKCSNCNHEVSDEMMFCPYCGSKVENDSPVDDSLDMSTDNEIVKENSTHVVDEVQKDLSGDNSVDEIPELKKTNESNRSVEKEQNMIESTTNSGKSGFDLLVSNKKQLVAFILSALTSLFAMIYLFKLSPSGLMLIYTMLLLSGSALLTIYNFESNKKNNNLLSISMYVLIVAFLIRIGQSSANHGIEAMIRYMGLGFGTAFFHNQICNNKNTKIIAYFLLAIGGADAIYLFFSLGNTIITGYSWRLFLLAEFVYSISLICMPLNTGNGIINDTFANINIKLNAVLVTIVGCLLTVVLYFANGEKSSDYNSFNGSSNSSNSGSSVEDRTDTSSSYTGEDTPQVQSVLITKNSTKTVKVNYSGEEYEAEISLDSLYTTKKVTPPNPTQSYYTYYEAKEGKKFLVAVLNVKNVGAQTISSDYLFRNFLGDNCTLTAIFDGKYKYTSGTVVGLDKNNKNQYDLERYYYIDALEKVKIYIIYEIAAEISDKPVTVNACFGDVHLNLSDVDV